MAAANTRSARGLAHLCKIAGEQLQPVRVDPLHRSRFRRQRCREQGVPNDGSVGPPWLEVPVSSIGNSVELGKLQGSDDDGDFISTVKPIGIRTRY